MVGEGSMGRDGCMRWSDKVVQDMHGDIGAADQMVKEWVLQQVELAEPSAGRQDVIS